ncbi:hypothetical protein Scep_008633 [Stephania cephalantha]|uniref:Uncharacterized protein n=1 Tax=Stephania cephalantha TaxID=152367 RepID=A0AAP0PR45_9MAGN
MIYMIHIMRVVLVVLQTLLFISLLGVLLFDAPAQGTRALIHENPWKGISMVIIRNGNGRPWPSPPPPRRGPPSRPTAYPGYSIICGEPPPAEDYI